MMIDRPFGGAVLRGCVAVFWCGALAAQTVPDIGPINIDGVPGEQARLGERLSQSALGALSRRQQIAHGRRIFSTPFNSLDGLGDGPTAVGGRPALQNNGRFRRIDGMDSQTCVECHNLASVRSIPPRFAVGGAGGVSQAAFPNVARPDMRDTQGLGYADIQGDAPLGARMINPPFNFGSGGVELLAKEMTAELQRTLARARRPKQDGRRIALVAKGVSFGFITVNEGVLDTSEIEGIGADLVVRPFGRTGCCSTVRVFDTGALAFHHGMQVIEGLQPQGEDPDQDGVPDEILAGELSAMHIFQTSTPPYLHDGRAATLTEAILFHGGEAEAAQRAFAEATGPQRRRLLAFLRHLRTPTEKELAEAGNP